MAKLPRTTQKIFAKNAAAGQVTTFGSIKDGTPVYSTSAGDIMNSNFEDGWSAAVEDDYAPYRQDRNGVDTAVTQQLAYLFQEGIPEYDSGTVYYKGSICKVTDGTGVKIYKSIYDNHSAAVTNTSRWHLILNVDSTNTIVSPSISSPTISGGSMSNGTFANPTFSGTVNVPLASASSSTDSTIAASIGWANNPSLSSNIVHRTGDETIAGGKIFTGTIQVEGNFGNKNTNVTKGTNPETTQYWNNFFADKNVATSSNSLGAVITTLGTDGLATTSMHAYKNASGTTNARISISYPTSGSAYTSAPTPSEDTTSSTQIDTVGARNTKLANYALDSNVVKLTGDQTISGSKTFVSTLQTTTNIVYKRNVVTKGTNPESKQYWQFYFADKNGSGDENALGKILTTVDSTGLVQTSMYAYKNASGTSNERIAICYPTSGSAYTYAPTPATSDNTTKIATTAFVKSVLSSSGNGLATFSKAQNGYIKFTNGIIFQWGYINSPASSITYPQPFSSATSYSITTTAIRSSGGTNWRGQVNTRTTTGCNIVTDSSSEWLWIAIGY